MNNLFKSVVGTYNITKYVAAIISDLLDIFSLKKLKSWNFKTLKLQIRKEAHNPHQEVISSSKLSFELHCLSKLPLSVPLVILI